MKNERVCDTAAEAVRVGTEVFAVKATETARERESQGQPGYAEKAESHRSADEKKTTHGGA